MQEEVCDLIEILTASALKLNDTKTLEEVGHMLHRIENGAELDELHVIRGICAQKLEAYSSKPPKVETLERHRDDVVLDWQETLSKMSTLKPARIAKTFGLHSTSQVKVIKQSEAITHETVIEKAFARLYVNVIEIAKDYMCVCHASKCIHVFYNCRSGKDLSSIFISEICHVFKLDAGQTYELRLGSAGPASVAVKGKRLKRRHLKALGASAFRRDLKTGMAMKTPKHTDITFTIQTMFKVVVVKEGWEVHLKEAPETVLELAAGVGVCGVHDFQKTLASVCGRRASVGNAKSWCMGSFDVVEPAMFTTGPALRTLVFVDGVQIACVDNDGLRMVLGSFEGSAQHVTIVQSHDDVAQGGILLYTNTTEF